MLKTLVPLLVPLMTGIVGAAGLMLKESLLARDRRNVRERALAEASAEVAFAGDWWKTHQLVGADDTAESTRKTLAWLAEAEGKVAEARHMTVEKRNPVTVQRLFLMHSLHRRSARVLRAFFWVSVLWIMASSIAIATDASSKSQHDWVSSDIVQLIIAAGAVLILRAAVVAADRQDSTAASAARRPIQRVRSATADSVPSSPMESRLTN